MEAELNRCTHISNGAGGNVITNVDQVKTCVHVVWLIKYKTNRTFSSLLNMFTDDSHVTVTHGWKTITHDHSAEYTQTCIRTSSP